MGVKCTRRGVSGEHVAPEAMLHFLLDFDKIINYSIYSGDAVVWFLKHDFVCPIGCYDGSYCLRDTCYILIQNEDTLSECIGGNCCLHRYYKILIE